MEPIKFIRRADVSKYVGTQTISITIGADGGTDTDDIEFIPIQQCNAYEVEIEGKRVILLGFERDDVA